MKKIHLYTTMSGPSGTHYAGSEPILEDAKAKSLVDCGAARYVDNPDDPPKETHAPATATAPAADENAAAGKGRKRKPAKTRAKRKN